MTETNIKTGWVMKANDGTYYRSYVEQEPPYWTKDLLKADIFTNNINPITFRHYGDFIPNEVKIKLPTCKMIQCTETTTRNI